MSRKTPFVFSVCLLLFFVSLKIDAQTVLDVAETTTLDLSKNRLFYEDKTGKLTFEEIQNSKFDKEFRTSDKDILNYGFTTSTIWLKVKLKNSNLQQDEYLALVNSPMLDEVDFYFQKSNQNEYSVYKTGDRQPFIERLINNRNFLYPLNFSDTTIRTLYLRVANKTPLQVPFEIITKSDYQVKANKDELGYGLFYGILCIMIAYNFFVFLSLKDLNYLYYIITIFGSLTVFFSLSGHQGQYLFPQNPLFANQFVPFGSSLIMIGLSLFTIYFNDVRKYSLVFYRLLLSFTLAGCFVLIFIFLKSYWYGKIGFFTNIVGLFELIIVLLASIYCFKRGQKSARFFILAFSLYVCGLVTLIFKNLGILPVNFLTANAGEIGASLEVLFLSFALSDRYNLYRKQKEATQKELITVEKEAKETLELKVQKRTSQLQKVNKELTTLNEETHQQSEEIMAQRDALSKTMSDLEETVKELNKQKTDIISSINYAKTIQTAMLPLEECIAHSLDNFFIFNKPRDIVSGDFYFFEDKGTHIIFAVLDCTGHGVPGAFMSMIGHEILSDAINVKKIYSPDLILEELHKGIRNTLQQEQTANRDGMDAVIVSIKKNDIESTDSKFEYLEYAGAMNPFYYIQKHLDKNKDQTPICQSIKATKRALGGKQKENEIRKFEKHRVELEGYQTKFWLCTDGFQDQFGGEKNRKFMVKSFRELLFSMHNKDTKEQHKMVRTTFRNWKGFNNQVDDVLVIGVEI
ncbi:7TM diverse intracellular signaling domain-containing protein [Bernardetia sp. ABR2-2B]|uniref:7TM diverse intracellular signaling domain-containing protein n=1 Tax=Bernardetia sp. ABR2-2B TaxID=3127472 RepID=UPI0030CAFA6A